MAYTYDITDPQGPGAVRAVFSNNDRSLSKSGGGAVDYCNAHGTADMFKDSGVWYWETLSNGGGAGGISDVDNYPTNYTGGNNGSYSSYSNNARYHNGASVASAGGFNGVGTLRHLLDIDNLTYSVALNGGSFADFPTIASGKTWVPYNTTIGGTYTLLLESSEITYSIPAGASLFVPDVAVKPPGRWSIVLPS